MEKMWGVLFHFGELWGATSYESLGIDRFRLDKRIWNRAIDKCVEVGVDTIIIDLCEGIVYKSHPELAVPGAWSYEEFHEEIKRIISLGIKVIPKFNFSAAHDSWLKEYGEDLISTPTYYKVCKDLIEEAYELFEHPEYIHLGLDEESPDIRTPENHFRTKEMLYHDYNYLINCVREVGAKPCMWNTIFLHWEDAYEKFDKDVTIFTEMYYTYKKEDWSPISDQLDIVKKYYAETFKKRDFYPQYVEKYGDVPIEYIEQDPVVSRTIGKRERYVKEGYNIVIATSNIFIKNNEWATFEYYSAPEQQWMDNNIAGFLACSWKEFIPEWEESVISQIELLGKARKAFYSK